MRFWMRFQLLFVSLILLATFALLMLMTEKANFRWDATKEKIYSISPTTKQYLKALAPRPVEVIAFYPHDDPARNNFEVFLKECQLHHPAFRYSFYDPDRVPRLARKLGVKEIYTVIMRFENRQEKILGPSEESFTNSLLRLANPRHYSVCFVTGHDESVTSSEERTGLSSFRKGLEEDNARVHEIILIRDGVPKFCDTVVVPGPHHDLDPDELSLLYDFFDKRHGGLFFLVDPMDPGTGKSFSEFGAQLGVIIREDVLVDKMSRVAGGDFLVPPVSRYISEHPITAQFQDATFFPVVRSVQPAIDSPPNLDVVPLALTGSGSWAETDFAALEKGEAAFDPNGDLAGPIAIAVAVEKKGPPPAGRAVFIGDSDFLTNAYILLSGNGNLGANMIKWLNKDERFIRIEPRQPEFKPLFLDARQRMLLVGSTVAGLPAAVLVACGLAVVLRKRS